VCGVDSQISGSEMLHKYCQMATNHDEVQTRYSD